MTISKADISDLDIFDAYELSSDGTEVYRTNVSVISITASSKTIIVSDGLNSYDSPSESGDFVVISGTTSSNGKYTINQVINDTTFTINESIISSGNIGTATFIYPAGSKKIGFDKTGLSYITSSNVEGALKELDSAISTIAIGGGGTTNQRSLILLSGTDGPFESFASGTYKETLPSGNMFPTSITWWDSSSKTSKILEKAISYGSNKQPNSITYKVYDIDGISVLSTAADTITYSGSFEISRTRSITVTPSVNAGQRTLTLLSGVDGPFETFASGAFKEILPSASPFPTSFIWWESSAKLKKILEKTMSYTANKLPSLITYKVYDQDGSTILKTATDIITYSGVIEISRTRTIV